MDLDTLVTILAGGMFGVVLGKFLDEAPNWVFWAILVALLTSVAYLST